MNTHTGSHDGTAGRPEDDSLALLIRQAGRRPEPPAEAYQEILQATHDTWRGKVRARRRSRMAWSIAATLLLTAGVVGVVRWTAGPIVPPATVASVDHDFGLVMIRGAADPSWRVLGDQSTPIVEGTRIRTGDDSGLALRLAGGESLRLAQQSEVALGSARLLALDRGSLYLDSGAAGRSDVRIHTPLGDISHIGTQFEATYTVNEMRLRVREGEVRLRHGDEIVRAAAGTEVVVDHRGSVTETEILPYGAHWDWVQTLATLPDTDEQPLSAFLDWIARETGRTVHFASTDLRLRAHTTILHGEARRLIPMEALSVMLQTTDFQYTVTGESEILIEDRRP